MPRPTHLVLYPKDTVGTSEATRLDVPDGGSARADGAGKSQAPSIFKTITLTSVGLRPSRVKSGLGGAYPL